LQVPHIGYILPNNREPITGHVFFDSNGFEPTRMKNDTKFTRHELYEGARFVPMDRLDTFSSDIDLRMFSHNTSGVDIDRLPKYDSDFFSDFTP
jgi:hypothetical protein